MSEVHFSAIAAKDDPFNESAVRCHIALKAGYQECAPGSYKAINRFDRFYNWVMGNTAIDRYKRSYFEANQHAAAALVGARYRARARGEKRDINDDTILKNRVYRNDFIRYNPGLRNALRKSILGSSDPKKPFMTLGQSRRNTWSMFLSRCAHFTDGLNELAAAPTGLGVKMSKLIWTPKLKDHNLVTYARLIVSLPVIAISVSVALFGILALGIGTAAVNAPAAAASLFTKLDAVAGMCGAVTYALGLTSAGLLKEERLNKDVVAFIDNNRKRYMQRLVRVLRSAANQKDASKMLRIALNIEGKCDSQRGRLFNTLIDTVVQNRNDESAQLAVESVLARHFTLRHQEANSRTDLLDTTNLADRRMIASRERDFVKIANLLEHARTETHIGDDGFNNHRTNIEKGAVKLRAYIEKLAKVKSEKHQAKGSDIFTVDRILSHPHQYAWWVRGAAFSVKFAHLLSFGVAMSTNYLMTRPFAAAHRTIERWCTGGVHSRSLSFCFGRALGGFAWAGIFLGCGNYLYAVELFKLGQAGALNISSTAIQMLGLSGAGAMIAMALEAALRASGGYKGDSDTAIDYKTASGGMPPLRWV